MCLKFLKDLTWPEIRMQSVKIYIKKTTVYAQVNKYKWDQIQLHLIILENITISVTPFPAKLSARSLVSLLSLYGM